MSKVKIPKRKRSVLIGIVCGLLCALSVGVYVTEVNSKAAAAQAEVLAEYGGEQIEVCVAKRDVAAGQTITEGDIETRTWIVTLLPAGAVTDRRNAVGKQVGSTILAGEVISESRFGFETAQVEVPDGFVALSVPSRDVKAVGGALKPGVIVDVYAVGSSSTTRIANRVQVLATSKENTQSSSGTNAWVTVAIKPDIVQELVSAAENLEVYFALPSESVLQQEELALSSQSEKFLLKSNSDSSIKTPQNTKGGANNGQ